MATPASAAHWQVDHGKSRLGFSVLWAKEPFSATFQKWQAQINFDPSNPAAAKVDVRVDLASEKSEEAQFDDGLKGALGFETSKFPQAHFVTTRVVRKGGEHYVASGILSLHGVSRPITLLFTLKFVGNTAHMVGTAQVMRNDFAVGQGMWAAAEPVAHAVTVTIDLTATKS